MSYIDELEWRGLLYDTSEGARELLASEAVTGYIGFDPTADSLHVGSLLPALALARLQRYGHSPIALVGGGTGMIGDPSGKSQERTLLSREQLEINVAGIRAQLERFLDFDARDNPAQLVNNADWLVGVELMDFLREIGKHFTVNYMMAKESVRRRLDSEDGISYTEFSYMLLQAYDYLVLHDRHGCRLQMGGSDQWGNIVAGTDLIRKLRGERAYGVVSPLVTTSSGVKFGKTEAGAVWLDPERTSPYRFYQFWINTDDSDVLAYLKYFTHLDQDAIEELASAHDGAPQERQAQRRLASEVTAMVHGESALERAQRASAVLFGEEIAELEPAEILDIFADVPSSELPAERLAGDAVGLLDLLVETGVASSKGDARRAVRGGGIYLNNVRIGDERCQLGEAAAIGGQLTVLRKGRKKYHLVRWLS